MSTTRPPAVPAPTRELATQCIALLLAAANGDAPGVLDLLRRLDEREATTIAMFLAFYGAHHAAALDAVTGEDSVEALRAAALHLQSLAAA